MIKMAFGEQLRKLFDLTGESINSTSKATGIKAKLLHEYMADKVEPIFSKIAQLSTHFEVPPNSFFSNSSPDTFIQARSSSIAIGHLLTLPKQKQDLINELLLGYTQDYHQRMIDGESQETLRVL